MGNYYRKKFNRINDGFTGDYSEINILKIFATTTYPQHFYVKMNLYFYKNWSPVHVRKNQCFSWEVDAPFNPD